MEYRAHQGNKCILLQQIVLRSVFSILKSLCHCLNDYCRGHTGQEKGKLPTTVKAWTTGKVGLQIAVFFLLYFSGAHFF